MKMKVHGFVLGACLWPCLALSAEVKIEENVMALFSASDSIRPAVYKTVQREFSQSDMDAKLEFLKSQGFNPSTETTGTAIIYKDDSTGATFSYFPERSEYNYMTRSSTLNDFTDADRADTNKILAAADTFLIGIMGDDGKNFKLDVIGSTYAATRDVNGREPLLDKEPRVKRVVLVRSLKGSYSKRVVCEFSIS